MVFFSLNVSAGMHATSSRRVNSVGLNGYPGSFSWDVIWLPWFVVRSETFAENSSTRSDVPEVFKF